MDILTMLYIILNVARDIAADIIERSVVISSFFEVTYDE